MVLSLLVKNFFHSDHAKIISVFAIYLNHIKTSSSLMQQQVYDTTNTAAFCGPKLFTPREIAPGIL
jgi:hypothetical protein